MQYVAYYRVSTQMQGKSGLGIDAQRAAVQNFTNGYGIIAEFTEVESGKRDDRPELDIALEQAKQQNAVLVIAKLDRLSRDVHFISGLLKRNVPIKACDMPHADNFQFHIMAAVAEKEREMVSQRTSAAIAVKRARGQSWGTNAVRVEQADTFAQSIHTHIQMLLDSGVTTPAAIARGLNERDIRTSRGTQWGAGQVVRLLRRVGQN
ncbi:DNA invertase Pin-like site-specific DNA recombinase [Rhizobium sp. RAS22]|nr:DNA invertase Pin-like site-specific DNA recombinase [Rhizobium sp. RAS22]